MLFIRQFLLLVVLLTTALLATPARAAIAVSVGIEPMRYLLEQIGAERVQVTTLLSSGDPHAIDPTPAQLLALKKAELYFAVGLPFERGLGGRLGDDKKLFWLDEQGVSVAHSTDDKEHAEHEHGHEHALGIDPHRWASPAEMLRMATVVTTVLQARDPEADEFYTRRLQLFEQKIIALQAYVQLQLQSSALAMVADHPAWGWFCDEFSLQQLAVEHEGKLPSIRQMSQLKKDAKASGARFVVSEHGGAQAQALASALELRLLIANPLSYEWEATLRKLAEDLGKP